MGQLHQSNIHLPQQGKKESIPQVEGLYSQWMESVLNGNSSFYKEQNILSQ
jgi:hypothetical protein